MLLLNGLYWNLEHDLLKPWLCYSVFVYMKFELGLESPVLHATYKIYLLTILCLFLVRLILGYEILFDCVLKSKTYKSKFVSKKKKKKDFKKLYIIK